MRMEFASFLALAVGPTASFLCFNHLKYKTVAQIELIYAV